jgi:hypothetical protein
LRRARRPCPPLWTAAGCVPADHLDEIGHLLGDHPGLGNDFDHVAF